MQQRKSNFEILRIVSIVMILIFHNVYKSGIDLTPDISTLGGGSSAIVINRIICDIITHFGEIGVDCFVLISGYFAPETKFKWKKAILYVCSVQFYIILNKLLRAYYGLVPLSNWKFSDWLFPVYRNLFWFCTAYFLIYIITPYLKKLIEVLSKKEFTSLIISQLLIWSILPTFILCMIYKNGKAESIPYYNRYLWLIVVYLIGAYIRLYGVPYFKNLKRCLIGLAAVWALLIFFIIGTEYRIFPWKTLSQVYFWPPNTMPVISISVLMLLIFKYINVPYLRIVNFVASCTLGIYMFHDGELQRYYWQHFTDIIKHYESPYFILWIIGGVSLVFILGLTTETLRKLAERFTLIPLIDAFQDVPQNKGEKRRRKPKNKKKRKSSR